MGFGSGLKTVRRMTPEEIASNNKLKAESAAKSTPTASSGTLGANKSATNRAMGMQSKGGLPAQQAASGNVGVVSQGMVNAEIQNDDVLDPTKLMGM